MTVRSNIFQMPPPSWKPGYCWLCGDVRLLRFRDAATGQTICQECVEFVLIADQALHIAKKDGIRTPTHEESTSLPNN